MRQPTYDEETEILGFFEAAEKGLARRVVGNLQLAIDDVEDGRVVSLVPAAMWDLPEDVVGGAQAALRIGTLEAEGFALDLQGAMLWARHSIAQVVRVTEKASRLWLYGRNILGISIERADRRLKPGEACIIVNPRGEALGIGEVVGNFKGRGEAVHPVHDLGQYLRDQ